METNLKQCAKCLSFKDINLYNICNLKNDGRDPYCDTCRVEYNNSRMFVNGKYIPRSHPLYKAGRYKSFEEAAFSNLVNYKRDPRGHVYIITNDAWRGWVKVGKAVDANDRLNSYQTSSPMRDYELYAAFNVNNRSEAEKVAHSVLDKRFERRNEWFKCDPDVAATLLEEVL